MKRIYFYTGLAAFCLIVCPSTSGIVIDKQSLQKITKSTNLLEIIDLKLSGKKITKINETAFHSLFNLEFLDLSHNQLTTLPSAVFRGLAKLERISLYFNYITHLDSYTFFGLSSLNYLDLERNQISNIQPNTFKGLKSLWYLDLDSNNLTQLNKGVLSDLKILKYLFLKNNNISLIEKGFIQNINELCLNFFYFENNRCLIEHQFSHQLNQTSGCIRINATSCDEFHYERITTRKQQQRNDNEKELQILR
jgi:Leucine-rich repeat (LRR) protein